MAFDLNGIDIHTPSRYAHSFPWAEWEVLRREAPVFWYERDDIEPFWAVTRHAEVMVISERPKIFINGGPRLRLALKGETELLRGGLDSFGQSRGWNPQEPPDLTFMDDPQHREVRKQWYAPDESLSPDGLSRKAACVLSPAILTNSPRVLPPSFSRS